MPLKLQLDRVYSENIKAYTLPSEEVREVYYRDLAPFTSHVLQRIFSGAQGCHRSSMFGAGLAVTSTAIEGSLHREA